MEPPGDDVAAVLAELAAAATEPDEMLRAMRKIELVDQLAKAAPHSDAALVAVADALSDDDRYDRGASPWGSYIELVAEHAYFALLPIGPRAEPHIAAQLERSLLRDDAARRRAGVISDATGVTCRGYALRLLDHLPALAPATIDLVARCASDPSSEIRNAALAVLRKHAPETARPFEPST